MNRAIAITAVVAIVVCSCQQKLKQADVMDLDRTPVQTIENMFAVQSDKGVVKMRMEAGLMQRYEKDSASIELFPEGISVFGYSEEGLLESIILANTAEHINSKVGRGEQWKAYGDVVMQNVIKQETMETDTIYWDQAGNRIYTECYVRMYSKDGFMQGYGMESDDRARNAEILRPFNSYSIVVQDTAAVRIDSVNFIGPFVKK